MRLSILTVLFALSVPFCHALTDSWSVDVNAHSAVQRTYKQGESWTLQISLRNGLKPLDLTGATAVWYWYTNATANVWWTNAAAIPTPRAGLITAPWTPAMDTGADLYAYWIGVWMPGATSPLWRVTGTLRMLDSPGWTPNALPLPVQTLDFSSVSFINAPWVTSADWASGSNALASGLSSLSSNLSAHAGRTDNPHGVTAAQIGAATIGELADVEAALAGYQSSAYWPPDATDSSWFTFTTNSGAITITGYNIDGGTDVVIPDYINGWPVTVIGDKAFSPEHSGLPITSISGGNNIEIIGSYAFVSCNALTTVTLPNATTIGNSAFKFCGYLTTVTLTNATTIGHSAFCNCSTLTTVTLPNATTIVDRAFDHCVNLTSIYFGGNVPSIGINIFFALPANKVTNYVTNPQATGWGETLGGMPVVRQPVYADAIHQAGELVATTGDVAQAIAGKVDMDAGTATNLWLQGETIVSDSYTNLWWRNVFSNGWHWLVAYTNAPGGGE